MFRLFKITMILFLLITGTSLRSIAQDLIEIIPPTFKLTQEQQKYKDALLKNTNVTNYQFVKINSDFLLEENANRYQINIQNELSCIVSRERSYRVSGNRLVWIGRSADMEGFVRFVVHGDIVNAKIDLLGHGYSIFPLTDGLHLMFKDTDANLGDCEEEGFQQARDVDANYDTGDPGEPHLGGERAGECSLRMMVVFTQAVKTASADVTTLVEGHVADWNVYNSNSNVDYTVELARCIATDYVATGAAEDHPTYGNDSQDMIRLYETSDGFMDEMHAIRNQYDADFVSLFVTTLHSGGGEALPIGAVASDAFHTMLWNNFASTFAHESGHLFGLRHSHDNTNTPYAYGHGWHVNNSFATVMAYTNQCGTCGRAPNWSNPSINVAGVPSGTAGFGDAARVNREQDQTMSGFQTTVTNKLQFTDDTISDEEQADLLGNSYIETDLKTVIIESGGSATYRAGDYITLEPGFHAKSGSQFTAFLDDCSAMNKMDSGLDDEEFVSDDIESEKMEVKLFPNPFNSSTTLKYYLSRESEIHAVMTDALGRTQKAIVVKSVQSEGWHTVEIDGQNLAAGIYHVMLIVDDERVVRKIIKMAK